MNLDTASLTGRHVASVNSSGRQKSSVGDSVGARLVVGALDGAAVGAAVGPFAHLKPTLATPNHKSSGSVALAKKRRT